MQDSVSHGYGKLQETCLAVQELKPESTGNQTDSHSLPRMETRKCSDSRHLLDCILPAFSMTTKYLYNLF